MTAQSQITGHLTPADVERAYSVGLRRGTINEITLQVSDLTGVSVKDLKSKRRTDRIARARFLIWFIAHREGMSLMQIARAFDRDHTTILHGIQREQAARDAEVVA